MLGAIIGDIVGSRFEHNNYKGKDFKLCHAECRFTDDTVLTAAVAEALLEDGNFTQALKKFYRAYPHAGYGGYFQAWARSDARQGYHSFGNGSAMRVSPVAWFYDDFELVLEQAAASARVTHNHPEGIKGAQAVANAIFRARQGEDKSQIRKDLEDRFGYALRRTPHQIRPGYQFDVTCQGSVPEAICCFLDAADFEDAIRAAVSIGGDSDTIACITGSIAEAYFGGVPEEISRWAWSRLDTRLQEVVKRFQSALSRQLRSSECSDSELF